MNIRSLSLSLLAALLLAPSCLKENDSAPQAIPSKSVTITVRMGDDVKVGFADEDNTLKLAWQEGDCIRVISGGASEVYTVSKIISDHVAEFTGIALGGSSFDILCPGTYASAEEAEADLSGAVQEGNGSTAHLRYKALLSGVDCYTDLKFSSDWALEHGGSFRQCAAVKVTAQLPEGVTVLEKLSLRIAGKSYSLGLSGVDVSLRGAMLTAYMMLPWEEIPLPDGSAIQVVATASDKEVYSSAIHISGDRALLMGRLNTLKKLKLTLSDFVDGDGTEENPYLIANARQLKNLMDIYKNAAAPSDKDSFKKYFRLVEDVDASGISWTPLNGSGSFYKAMDFDGEGHTLSGLSVSGTYASFAGVLYGSIRNITFEGAAINGGSTKCGVIGGFVGTTGLQASCENVIINNSAVSGKSYCGGFGGHFRTTGSITGCTVMNTTVSGEQNSGGFAAFADITGDDKYEVPVRFVDCHVVDVTVNQNCTTADENVFTGGFIACANTGAGFTNCTVKATVNADKSAVKDVGAFIGRASYACPTFRGCKVLPGTTITAMGAHVGGFVGYSIVAASYADCSSAATVTNSSEYTGGFAGYSEGASSFVGCSASGNVTSTKHAGGFVGTAVNSAFTDCFYSGGTVSEKNSGKSQSGGFCGLATTGVSFRGCYVKDAVFSSPSGTYVGGFIGQLGNSYLGGNNVSASQCHVEGTSVTGSTNCGGFVGVQYDHISSSYVSGGSVTARAAHCGGFSGFVQNGNLQYCYTTSPVNGGSYAQVGGFAGIIYTTNISYCYSAGSVSGSGSDTGAFIGKCDQQSGGTLASVSSCIAWSGSLPFCATNSVGATLADNYVGVEGTVTSQAQALSWPAAIWDFSAPLPTLLDKPRRINAIFIGDSITWQWARTSNTFASSNLLIPFDSSYMSQSGSNVTVLFHPAFFTANSYLDKGVSGQNTTQMLSRFKKDVVDLNPVVAVIMAGTNDLAQGVTKEQILSNISSMSEMADEAGIKVILCTVTPCNESYSRLSNPKTKGAHIITLNGMLKDYADSKGFSWCDYWSHLVADDGLALHPNYCLYDKLHPGPAGYDVMEGIIKPLIDGLL